jgi:hypothetical protein
MLERKTVNISKDPILTDNGHIYLSCSSCNKKLVDLFIVKKDESLKWKVMAKCCYCNDKSFITEVSGMFRPCGIMKISETDPDDSKLITQLANIKNENDTIVFYTKKGDCNE